MNNINKKIENEKIIIRKMILVYCKGHHHTTSGEICDECSELVDYAYSKIDKCPFMETKTFCSNCKVHCYDKIHRERIRQVMKYSGPRMIFQAPLTVISHVISSKFE